MARLMAPKSWWPELRWAVAVGAVAVLVANVPYVAGYAAQTTSTRYAGIAVAPGDNLSYLAAVGQGHRGSWSYQLPHTACSHQGLPVHMYYLMLGHVSRVLSLSEELTFHVARGLGGLFLMLIIYRFLVRITPNIERQRLTYLLIAFSSGLGWLMLAFGELLSTDLTVPESNTFLTLMDNPHFPVALAMLLLYWLTLLAPAPARTGQYWLLILASAACLGVLAIIQPFMVAIVVPISGLFYLWRWRRDGKAPRFILTRIVAAALLSITVVGVITYRMNADPLGREWLRQNLAISPPAWYFLTGYGLLLLVAVVGAKLALQRRTDSDLLLLLWAVIAAMALYAPTAAQRRFSLGLHIPIAALAALGLLHVLRRAFYPDRQWMVSRLFVVATIPTTLLLIVLNVGGMVSHNPKLYLSASEHEAFSWLDGHAEPGEVVLASTELGVFVPARTAQRSVSGHAHTTPNSEQTERRVAQFYSGSISPDERRRMLEIWAVDYVILGPRERAHGARMLSAEDGATLAAQFNDVSIFEVPHTVVPEGATASDCPP